MIDNFFKPGDTLISSQTVTESLMIISPNINRRFLLPVIFKYDSFQNSAIKLIESIVLHERIFTLYDEKNRDVIFSSSKTDCLKDFILSFPPSFFNLYVESLYETSFPDHKFPFFTDANFRKMSFENFHNAHNKYHNDYLYYDDEHLRELQIIVFQTSNSDIEFSKNLFKKNTSNEYDPHNVFELIIKYFSRTIAQISEERITSDFGINYTSIYDNQTNTGFTSYKDNTILLTANELATQIKKINTWSPNNYLTITTPLVFDYIVQKAKKNDNLLEVALDIRNSKEATAFRKQCINFEVAVKNGNQKQIIEMIGEIENAMSIFAKNLSAPPVNLDISVSYPPAVSFNYQEVKKYVGFKQKLHLLFLSRLYKSALESNHTMDKFVRLLK